MIIEYGAQYDEEIKDLLVELQEHIQSIDIEGYNVLTEEYRDLYFTKTMDEVKKYNGKILLYKQDKIEGLVVGVINNEKIETYDFKAPKRGRITELVVSKNVRKNGIGASLLKKMEDYLISVGCEDILLGVIAYNNEAIKFYERNGYHVRTMDLIKKV